ncbi:MAG: hypothetical protein ACOC5E_01620 [Acidobacteriota bacterium]
MHQAPRAVLRIGSLLAALLLAAVCPALAQNPIPRVPPDRDERPRHLPLRPHCWERGPARATDWVAERNAEYRRGVFARYTLEPLDSGWRWYRRQLVEARNLRPSRSIEGLVDSELVVRVPPEGAEGRASYRVDDSLHAGTVELEWSEPPELLCAHQRLDLRVGAHIVDGDPGEHRVGMVLPLSDEQRVESGSHVRACSPGDVVGVDSVTGIREDEGRCRRFLDHLPPGSSWSLMVTLPESFFVVYRYRPEGSE